jgi:hypothetical protein
MAHGSRVIARRNERRNRFRKRSGEIESENRSRAKQKSDWSHQGLFVTSFHTAVKSSLDSILAPVDFRPVSSLDFKGAFQYQRTIQSV